MYTKLSKLLMVAYCVSYKGDFKKFLFIHVFRVFILLFSYYFKIFPSNVMKNRKTEFSPFSHRAILEIFFNLMRSLTYTSFY